MSNSLRLAVSLLAIASVTACGTPSSVRNLAKKTSDNTVDFALSLDKFQRTSAADAERRATNIARITASIDEGRVRHERGIALAEKAGREEPVGRYKDLRKLADEWAIKEAEKKGTGLAKRQAVLDAQMKLETEAAGFRELGEQLLELSKADDGKSRVTFLVGFVKDVVDDLRAAEEETKAATE